MTCSVSNYLSAALVTTSIFLASCGASGDIGQNSGGGEIIIPSFLSLDPLDESNVPAQFSLFKQNVQTWGETHHQTRVTRRATLVSTYSEIGDGTIYYDAGAGLYEAFYKLGLSGFNTYGDFAQELYEELLVNLSTPYNISGRRNFNIGFFLRYIGSSDAGSKAAIAGLREQAVPSDFYIDGRFSFYQSQHEGNVREIAYKLQNLILYEASDNITSQSDAFSNNVRINAAKNRLILHANALASFQYTAPEDSAGVSGAQASSYPDWKFTQVFMLGLLADALVDYIDWLGVRRAGMEAAGYIGTGSEGLQTRAEALAEIKPVILNIGELLFDKSIVVARVNTEAPVTLAVGDVVNIVYGTTTYRRVVTLAETNDGLLADRLDDFAYFNIAQPVIVNDGDLDSPTITATRVSDSAVLTVEIEQVVDPVNTSSPSRGKLWIADLGGSPGAWSEATGNGFGAFRYAVPNYYSPLGSGRVGIPTQSGGANEVAAPDLNLLTLPIMGFLHREGHPGVAGSTWLELGDAVFNGGVRGAAWDRTRVYNQQLKNSFKYLEARQLTPATW